MKNLKVIVGLILLGLSLLLFYQFSLNIYFVLNEAATFGQLWMDMGLYLISGVLILRYGWVLLRSTRKKKRAETLDEREIN